MKRFLTILILFSITSLPVLAQEEVEDEWTAFYQLIEIDTDKYTNFRLTGAVKANLDSPEAGAAGLWVRIDNKDGSRGFFDNMSDRLVTSNEWKSYTIEGEINKEADLLYFGGLVFDSSSNSFYFDKFNLEFRDKSGVWTSLDFEDPSFETSIENSKMKHWIEGVQISQNIRAINYTITSSTDAFDGKKSLMIKRK